MGLSAALLLKSTCFSGLDKYLDFSCSSFHDPWSWGLARDPLIVWGQQSPSNSGEGIEILRLGVTLMSQVPGTGHAWWVGLCTCGSEE